MLLLASYFFYGSWKIEFLSLLVISTICDFLISRNIERSEHQGKRKRLLALSLFINLGILFFFKYSSFIAHELVAFTSFNDYQKAELLNFFAFDLPVGISFYTFQTLGYTIDVYFKRTKAQQNIGKFALYVSYFPQFVAGPIERYSHLSPQLFKNIKLNYRNLSDGFRLVLYGFFIKMVIADNIAPVVDQVFSNPSQFDSLSASLGVFGFGWQIYADFYGYSLIAIGVAKSMGVNLMDNFKTPYFSVSISQFWQRWHISLSTWFRDYLYVPLGGNRVSQGHWIKNILAVFLLSGLWHGANWTFIIWGAIHALMYILEKYFPIKWKRTNLFQKVTGLIITYLTVNLAWTFFRASSFESAMGVLSHISSFETSGESLMITNQLIILFILFLIFEITSRKQRIDEWLNNFPIIVRWIIYTCLLFCIWTFAGTTNHPFIYFQF